MRLFGFTVSSVRMRLYAGTHPYPSREGIIQVHEEYSFYEDLFPKVWLI